MAAMIVPAAASAWVSARLEGPRRRAEIVAQGPHAVYVDVDGDCLGVLGRDAVALPIGLRTTLPRLPRVIGPVEVGAGSLTVGKYAVTVARIVDPAVPRLGSLPAWPAPVPVDLPAPALRALADAEPSAVLDLLGRGDGLTPSGDDVLAGWLVARRATGRPVTAVAEAVLAHVDTRTTPLSASLLRRAAEGEAAPQCRGLLLALHAGSGVDAARDRLLAVGHTSGAALALGVSLALDGAR